MQHRHMTMLLVTILETRHVSATHSACGEDFCDGLVIGTRVDFDDSTTRDRTGKRINHTSHLSETSNDNTPTRAANTVRFVTFS